MNDLTAWHTANDEYLSAAINWLRLRLRRLAEQHQVPPEIPLPLPPYPRKYRFWNRHRDEAVSSLPGQAKVARVSDAEIKQAALAMHQAAAAEPPPALIILSRRLGLG